MSGAEKITTALLRADGPLVALVGSRIGAGPLTQETQLPALATSLVSRQRRQTIGKFEASKLVQARVQVTILAASYAQQKAVADLVYAACADKRGTIAGFDRVSTLHAGDGPDFRDDAASIYMQTIDFMVSHIGT